MSSVSAIHRDGVPLELESNRVDALKAALMPDNGTFPQQEPQLDSVPVGGA